MLYSFQFLSTVDIGRPLGDDTQVYPKPGNIGYQPFFQTQNSGLRKTTQHPGLLKPRFGIHKNPGFEQHFETWNPGFRPRFEDPKHTESNTHMQWSDTDNHHTVSTLQNR